MINLYKTDLLLCIISVSDLLKKNKMKRIEKNIVKSLLVYMECAVQTFSRCRRHSDVGKKTYSVVRG